jgi:hypothetical protein
LASTAQGPPARDRIDKVPFREDPDRLGRPVFDDQRTYAMLGELADVEHDAVILLHLEATPTTAEAVGAMTERLVLRTSPQAARR